MLLKQQKTNPSRGRPTSVRDAAAGRDLAPRVAGAVAVGQVQEALGERRLQRIRREEAVGDDEVDPVRAERAEVAEPAHLHGRRSQREDLAARAARVAVEVDQHVDAVVPDALRDARGGLVADVDEAVERTLDALAQRRVLANADAVCRDLEARAVVSLPHFAQQECDRMIAKVRRNVAEPQLGGAPLRARRRRHGLPRARGMPEACPGLGHAPLCRRRNRHRQRGKGVRKALDASTPAGDAVGDPLVKRIEPVPRAQVLPSEREQRRCIDPERTRPDSAGQCVRRAASKSPRSMSRDARLTSVAASSGASASARR